MKHLRDQGAATSSDYEGYLSAFASLLDRGDWKGAFDLALARFERNHTPGSLAHVCDALLAGQDHARFEAYLQRLIAMDGDPAEVLRLRASYAAAAGKHGAAVSLWLRYAELKPGKHAPLLRAARLCLEHMRLARLAPLLDRLRTRWPEHPVRRSIEEQYEALLLGEPESALRQSAARFAEARRWEEARKAWELLFAKAPNNAALLLRICDCLLEQGAFAECSETITLYLDDVKPLARFQDVCRRMLVGLAKADEVSTIDEPLLRVMSPSVLLAGLCVAAARSADDAVAVLAGHVEGRADVEFLAEAARDLIGRGHLDLARRFVDVAMARRPDGADLAFVALSLAWKRGDRDACRALVERLRRAPATIAASVEAFEPYFIAHYALYGPDAFLTGVASAAIGQGLVAPPAMFDLADRLHSAGEHAPLAFLLHEVPVADLAVRGCLDFLAAVFLDGAHGGQADERATFERFADTFSRWAIDDPRRFSRIAEVLLEHDRSSLLQLVLDRAAPRARDDVKLSRVRAQLAQKSGQWADAAALWLKVLDANVNDAWARINWTNAVIRAGDRAAGRAAFTALQASKEMRRGAMRSELVPLAARIGDLQTARQIALDVLDTVAAHTLRPHQKLQIARVLAMSGLPDLAWPLYGEKTLTKKPGAAKLAIILDPGLTRTSGHHVNYNVFAWRLINSLAGKQPALAPLVLCRETVDDTPELRDARIVPVLNFEPYAFDDLPDVYECLPGLNASFHYDLSRLDLKGEVGLVFMHSMRATMVDGFSRWIEEIFQDSKGFVVVGLIEVDHIMQADLVVRSVMEVYRAALERLSRIRNIGLLIYVETQSGKQFLEGLGVDGLEVRIFPYLAASLCLDYRKDVSLDDADALRVGMVGGTGSRRGSHLIPRLVASTADLAPHLRWKLQVNSAQLRPIMKAEDMAHLTDLFSRAHVDVADRVLNLREYFELLDDIEVVVLPYQERYAVSGSGVLYESIYMGKFLIVPRETFMPAVLAALKHPHMVIEEASDAYLEAAVREVVANRAKIKRQLATLRRSKARRLPSDQFHELVSKGVRERLGAPAPPVPAMS